ncbi:MAG: chorismate mutase, partial [Coprococcus sp.]
MTLDEVRLNIDKVDKEIKTLFKERMMLADNVARIKAETEDDIYKP